MSKFIFMEYKEIRDLIVSAVVLSFVFAYSGVKDIATLPEKFILSLFAVSLAFIFHELAHRYFARRFGCYARFEMWANGLVLAVLLTILTNGNLKFAAPGAVVIYPRIDLWGNVRRITRKENAIISAAGPVTNMILAIISLVLVRTMPDIGVFFYAYKINAWLALFNLIPIPPLDGSKIFFYNWKIWAALFAASFLIFSLI